MYTFNYKLHLTYFEQLMLVRSPADDYELRLLIVNT